MENTAANDMLCYLQTGGNEGKFINQSKASLSATDMGVTYGRSVYDVIGIFNGALLDYKAHEDRLKRSMEAFSIPLFDDFSFIKEAIKSLMEKNKVAEGAVKILVTRGDPGVRTGTAPADLKPTLMLSILIRNIPSIADYNAGFALAAIETNWPRGNRTVKTTSMPDNAIANETAYNLGAKEAMYVVGGKVTEGGSTNPFFIKDGVIYTHPADSQILHGTVRAKFIQLAKEQNISVVEKAAPLDEWLNADAVFVCSTTKWAMLGTGIFVTKSENSAIAAGTNFGKNDVEFKEIKPTEAAMDLIRKVRNAYIKFADLDTTREKGKGK